MLSQIDRKVKKSTGIRLEKKSKNPKPWYCELKSGTIETGRKGKRKSEEAQ